MKKTLLRLLKFILPFKWWVLLAAVTGFLTVGSSVGLLMLSAYIIAKAALHPSVAELQVAIVGVRFFGIARGLFRYAERLISHEITFRLLANLRVWFYNAIEPLAPAKLFRFKSGDLLARLVADIESLQNIYIRVLAPPVTAVLVSLLMWFLFGMFSWLLALVLLIFMVLAGIGVPYLTFALSQKYDELLVHWHSEFSSFTIETVQGLPDILLYNQASNRKEQLIKYGDMLVRLQRRASLINAMHESLIGLLMNGAVLAILFLAIPMASAGMLDALFLSLLVLGTMAAFEAVMPLPAAALNLRDNIHAANRIFELVDAEPSIVLPPVQPPPLTFFDIEFRDVCFSYEPDIQILEHFSLYIKEGEKIIISGPSGVGKTTIASLLRRFWDVGSGEIAIGGVSINNFSQQDLSGIVGYVPQQAHLFNGTIRENLLLAKPDATEAELLSACRVAHIDRLLASSEGLDTTIGEQGLLLSGGERQRVAIARALLKNTPILILDEPLAGLDSHTGGKVLDAVTRIYHNRTLILITHLPIIVDGWRLKRLA